MNIMELNRKDLRKIIYYGWMRGLNAPAIANEMCQSLYSPDLSPSDYYLFSPLKAGLKGRNFASKEDIDMAIQTWIDNKPIEFFRKGIHSLSNRWQQCIDAEGNYFTKNNGDDFD